MQLFGGDASGLNTDMSAMADAMSQMTVSQDTTGAMFEQAAGDGESGFGAAIGGLFSMFSSE